MLKMRIPLLLSSDALSEAQRWQLTSSLYDRVHSLIVQARRGGAQSACSPEAWARDYIIMMCAMAALLAATLAAVTFLFHDTQLVMFVRLLQIGWLAAAGIRSAASPAAIVGQALITVVPALYKAKQAGRDQVCVARPGRKPFFFEKKNQKTFIP